MSVTITRMSIPFSLKTGLRRALLALYFRRRKISEIPVQMAIFASLQFTGYGKVKKQLH